MMTATDTEIRIYVACLASYNNGRLYGRWIDATGGSDDIWAEIREMLAGSPMPGAEEWAIHDYEGFGGIRLSEYESIERVAEMASAIEDHGVAYSCYVNYVGGDPSVEDFEEAFCGAWENEEAYAENCVDEGLYGEIPEALENYIDYEKIARDLFCGDYFSADVDGETYIFRSI